MKLLIADDEPLTREGLISSIDWEALGINQIFQADDGIHALHIAKTQKPDIILSDIRMPRLNGIEMIEQLKNILPDVCIIFMSGYSDKEYLKAAIKLKAINYVEKPLNPDEIKEAILEASLQREQLLRSRRSANLLSIEASSQLALLLTKPYKDNIEQIAHLTDSLALRLAPGSCFTAFIVKLKNNESDSGRMNRLLEALNEYLEHYHMRSFYIKIHAVYHVFHILAESKPSATVQTSVEAFFQEHFRPSGDFFISRGETVSGITKAYQSYSSAVVTMQSSFFFLPGTVLRADDPRFTLKASAGIRDISELSNSFRDALLEKDSEKCHAFLDRLYGRYQENPDVFANQIKDLYYKLFIVLNDCRQKLKLSPDSVNAVSGETVLEYLENCFTYTELHQKLNELTDALFHGLDTYVPEDSTIFMIKDYIAQNYSSDTLSIKEISDHVFLSASYVCTYFKSQTGQTLNQYLTEYRMEKAMQLLGDARYQIADISSKVGYSNGNYFSKSFKKFTGLSPSKYREKILG